MLIRPDRDDLRIIAYYTGKVLLGVGLLLLVPLVVAIPQGAWNDVSALLIGAAVAVTAARLAEWRLATDADLEWLHGMVTVALSWLFGSAVVAIPLFLSGHFASWLDAYFDAMSGLTTSGLTLLQDLDHLSDSMNLLRHLSHFAGGQGIIIAMLSVFASSTAQLGTLYVGEGREDRVVPSVVRTARFIFLVAFGYLVVGTAALFVTGLHAGLSAPRALFHGFNVFIAAFDTGGFSPQSTSIAYYHSVAMELVIAALMIAGTFSFLLHYELWRGRLREVLQNLEVRSLAVTTALTALIAMVGLGIAGAYVDAGPLFRKGLFTILSAHTGTGFTVVSPRTYVTDWGLIAPAGVVLAMALGGMASSTAGGVKAIRVGLTAKSVLRDIRRALAPDSALILATYVQRRRRVVSDDQIRSAVTILTLFLVTYLAGALLGVFYGYDFETALFESTSAAANVGLSVGVLEPSAPSPLKLAYVVQMWVGRLEFMAAFALGGYLIAVVRGRM